MFTISLRSIYNGSDSAKNSIYFCFHWIIQLQIHDAIVYSSCCYLCVDFYATYFFGLRRSLVQYFCNFFSYIWKHNLSKLFFFYVFSIDTSARLHCYQSVDLLIFLMKNATGIHIQFRVGFLPFLLVFVQNTRNLIEYWMTNCENNGKKVHRNRHIC